MAATKIGIIGAGFMGSGIASVTAAAGLDVVLIDRDQESADKGKTHVHKTLTDQVNKGRVTGAQRDAVLAKITPTADYGALAGCDLVVEAVFEDRKVKAEATAKVQAVVPDVVFASNTSTLPITSLAETAKDASRFIGIHFFSPVERMLLVEVILGKKTGDAALALALDYVRAIHKTPIVVNDTRGFYANRCVLNYLQEGHLMLMEGVPPAMIENVARMAGMPVGPLSLNDEVALDLGWKIPKPPRPTSAQGGPPQQKNSCRNWSRSRAASGAKTARAFMTIRRMAPNACGPDLSTCSRKARPEKIDVTELKIASCSCRH